MNCAPLKRFAVAAFALVLVFVTPSLMPLGHAQTATAALNIVPGWNLVGMGSGGSLDVATAFGDAGKVTTVWKWVPAKSGWAFYAPSLAGQQLTDYAISKGYDVLTAISGGEGYWVNARTSFTAQMPAGTTVSSASFRASLFPGWNLIAIGDNLTASEFNKALSVTPPLAGETPLNVITLWAWDALQTNWYFYAPSLAAKGASALTDYITSKGYLDFGSKILDAGLGFWVNKAASTSPLVVNSLSKTSANPLSLITLNGAGFNPKARLHVRFFDATGFSLEIPAASASESTVSVATPPYIDMTAGRFGSATVSVQLVQRSGSETRLSAEMPGFTINALPAPPLANGGATDRWLNLAQYAAPGAKAGLQQLEISYIGAPSTSALRGWITGLEAEMAKMHQAIDTTAGGSPVTLGTFRGTPLVLDAASLNAMDQLVYAAILALGPNSPSPCAAKDAFEYGYMHAAMGSQDYADSRAGYWGGILTCTNTELLDFTNKMVAVLGVMGAIATATGVGLSLPAVAAIGFVAMAPAVFVILTQTEAISLSGASQQAAENLKGAVQLFQDSIFDPVTSSMLGLASPAASLSYDTFFAFKSATEETMQHLSAYDIPLSFAAKTTTTTTATTTTTTLPSNIVIFRGTAASTATHSQPNNQYCFPNPMVGTSTFTPITVELVLDANPLVLGPLSGTLYLGSTIQTQTTAVMNCVEHTEVSGDWVITIPAQTYPATTNSGDLPGYSIPVTGHSDGTNIVIDPFGYDSETFTATVSAAAVTGIVQLLGRHVFTISDNAATTIVTRTYTLTWQ